MDIPVRIAMKLITSYGGVFEENIGGHSFFSFDMVIIKLPREGNIEFDHLEFIAIEQLEIAHWEFDYFLGENGIV